MDVNLGEIDLTKTRELIESYFESEHAFRKHVN